VRAAACNHMAPHQPSGPRTMLLLAVACTGLRGAAATRGVANKPMMGFNVRACVTSSLARWLSDCQTGSC
jgi:hypothetical protein